MNKEYIELQQDLVDKINEITLTDYEIIDCKVQTEMCVNIIEDLINEYEDLLSEYNDYKEHVDEFYTEKKELRFYN